MINKFLILFLLATVFLFGSCENETNKSVFIVVHSDASEIIQRTANDLKKDLEKVLLSHVAIITDKEVLPDNATVFLLGTPVSNAYFARIPANDTLSFDAERLGPRGGLWAKSTLDTGQDAIVLAGSDAQGLQYAIYDYAKEILGIDPLEYWTGKLPSTKTREDLFNFKPRKIPPPKVPLLCYFENDVDELANYRGKLLEYDWESYTEMINSLVRLRYNAIQLFDMLGRPEFFIRPEYKALAPEYKIDVDNLEKMIDYAQSKGMKVAIDFALGYQIAPMSAEKATCWSEYKEDWMASWKYYLEETPLKKTDIFMIRPRHQVWDWEYQSSCAEDKIEVFNEVYKAFGDLVDEYKPNADKVLVCYSDGMQMWNDGFRPPKDWIVCWSDDGFGDFELLPTTTEGYDFGTYMHAGFWLNHTIHNPYPKKIEEVMKNAFTTLDADKFCLVNGQNFRPFLLNIEGYAKVCTNPNGFEGDQFYTDWNGRYFNADQTGHAVSSMKLLSDAQEGRIGYVQHLWEIREAISYLSDAPIQRPGKTPVPSDFERVSNDFEHLRRTAVYIEKSLSEAALGLGPDPSIDVFYHDYVYLPAKLYNDLIVFEQTLHAMARLKRTWEETNDVGHVKAALELLSDARSQLSTIYANRKAGDRNPKWENWYNPKIRRPNNGFPNAAMLDAVALNLKNKL